MYFRTTCSFWQSSFHKLSKFWEVLLCVTKKRCYCEVAIEWDLYCCAFWLGMENLWMCLEKFRDVRFLESLFFQLWPKIVVHLLYFVIFDSWINGYSLLNMVIDLLFWSQGYLINNVKNSFSSFEGHSFYSFLVFFILSTNFLILFKWLIVVYILSFNVQQLHLMEFITHAVKYLKAAAIHGLLGFWMALMWYEGVYVGIC